MASFYSVLPGLQPTQQDILEAELLALQILQAQFPDLDLREGTGLRDLLLRPSSMMLALCRMAVDFYFAQNTIQGVTNDTSIDVVDDIMSNWFLTRNLGTRAVISARLYFARQKTVSLTTDVYFSPDNTNLFYPAAAATYASGSLTYDSYQNEYYIDVNLTAASEGTAYNIGSGSLLYFANFDPYFLHGEINYLVDSSVASETNSQFITRSETAISTRNLINNPSITSNLQATFNYLNQIVSIGMGDPEMIRDEIQAVFTGEVSRVAGNISSVGSVATVTLAGHGYNSGQTVTISGAVPSTYNGEYAITVIDSSTFTYVMASSATSIVVMPSVQAVNAPLLIHNGGMVDVYCGNSLSTSLVQITTDELGNAHLTGAVYDFSRSSITGGTSDDTIPVNATVTTTSTTVDGPDHLLQVSAPDHGFITGQILNVTGISQTLAISSLTCSSIIVTATSPNHGLTTGTSVVISGATPASYNGTYTITVTGVNTFVYTVAFNIQGAATGTLIATNPSLTGNFNVTVLTADAFNVSMPGLWVNGISSGTPVLTYAVPYTVTNAYTQSQNVVSFTCSGTTVTATISNHGITANRYITITNATNAGYNGTWLVTNVLNKDQLQFTITSSVADEITTAAICSSIIPWYDYGFSSRQDLIIGFGAKYANSTASFQISYFDTVDSVQTYLTNSVNRVLCADLLARGFNMYSLDINVVAYNGVSPDSALITTTVNNFLTAMSPGAILVVSDLMASLNAAGITGIQNPIGINYTKYTRDLITPKTGTITDYLDPNDVTNIFVLNSVTTNNESV